MERRSRFVFPLHGAGLEHHKLFYDLLKHMMTLSAGAIVALVSFYEKFSSHRWKWSMAGALICFVISILTGLMVQANILDLMAENRKPVNYRIAEALSTVGFHICSVSFISALWLLVAYGVKNL